MTAASDSADRGIRHLPRHVAVIMDGNGRWAEQRKLPRFAGHQRGADAVERVVEACGQLGVKVLTLFAFSSENWRRPEEEVGMLMGLFLSTLEHKSRRMHRNNLRLRVIGDRAPFSDKLRQRILEAEELTAGNTGLELVIAANYGGRWDLAQAARRLARQVAAGEIAPADVDAERLGHEVCLADLPEPDLFIRTGGEQRLSNFLLWQLAYTELYFTDRLWPDFDREDLMAAIEAFSRRQRRYGRTGQQVAAMERA
jgi:undecaprenyl diphosphate synthase